MGEDHVVLLVHTGRGPEAGEICTTGRIIPHDGAVVEIELVQISIIRSYVDILVHDHWRGNDPSGIVAVEHPFHIIRIRRIPGLCGRMIVVQLEHGPVFIIICCHVGIIIFQDEAHYKDRNHEYAHENNLIDTWHAMSIFVMIFIGFFITISLWLPFIINPNEDTPGPFPQLTSRISSLMKACKTSTKNERT